MVVHLATENQLLPLSLNPIDPNGSGFSSQYVKRLEEILQFDLTYNGMTRVVLSKSEGSPVYLVSPVIRDQQFSATVSWVNSQMKKGIEGIALTGEIEKDRQQIHRVADAIYRSLFGVDGIGTTHLLYTTKISDPKKQGEWLSEVWEADYDGRNERQITKNGGYCVTPSYIPPSPGHRAGNFFYVSYATGQPKIYLASLKNGVGQRLTLLKGNQLMPTATLQRDQIAFVCDVTGNPDLFLQEFSLEEGAIGKPRQIFSAGLATQGTPTFSPDGKQVAFVSNKDGTARIYAMKIPPPGASLKQLKPTMISKFNKGSTAPAWSPDGNKIAYCAPVNGERQIWVYDFTTGLERQITEGKGNKENPSWAPNSLVLVYNSTDAGASELYLVTLKEPKPIKISMGRGEKHFPAWEPIANP